MADHAMLSASGSHRWLNCTPSARLELEFENTGSEAAREGTAAHALCEHKLKRALHIGERFDTKEIEMELDAATKAQRQAFGLQRKLESELDGLDVTDKHYDRKYESLNRRLDEAFEAEENAERKIADCEARLDSIKRQHLSKESIYESLRLFDIMYEKMTDYEKKSLVKTFISSIELYPDKKRRDGCPIKTVHFMFPVSYNGETVYSISLPKTATDETVVLLSKKRLDSCKAMV